MLCRFYIFYILQQYLNQTKPHLFHLPTSSLALGSHLNSPLSLPPKMFSTTSSTLSLSHSPSSITSLPNHPTHHIFCVSLLPPPTSPSPTQTLDNLAAVVFDEEDNDLRSLCTWSVPGEVTHLSSSSTHPSNGDGLLSLTTRSFTGTTHIHSTCVLTLPSLQPRLDGMGQLEYDDVSPSCGSAKILHEVTHKEPGVESVLGGGGCAR